MSDGVSLICLEGTFRRGFVCGFISALYSFRFWARRCLSKLFSSFCSWRQRVALDLIGPRCSARLVAMANTPVSPAFPSVSLTVHHFASSPFRSMPVLSFSRTAGLPLIESCALERIVIAFVYSTSH